MKKLNYVIMIALMFYTLQGCNNSSKGTTQTTDSSNKNNTSIYQNYKRFNQRDSSRVVSIPPLKVDSADAKFAIAAAGENLAEISMSVVALQITKDAKVKGFADSVITGHMKLNDELSAIAKTKNIPVPGYVSPERQKNIEIISKKTNKEFDRAYVKEIAKGTQKSIKLYQSAAVNVKDSRLKEFAAKAVVFMKKYPDLINKISSGTN